MKDQLGDLAEFTKGELTKIASEKWIGRTTNAIIKTIAKSFEEDLVLRPVRTKSEIQRRFSICARVVVELRRDLGWTMPRIFDELPTALRAKLDDVPWHPEDRRKSWASADGGSMALVNTGEVI